MTEEWGGNELSGEKQGINNSCKNNEVDII
jgi:hypothetical protein